MRSNILMRVGLIGLGGLILPAAALAQAQPATQPAPHATTAAAPATDAAHQRVLPLEGGQNFRDLGGYRTTDGRMVKWGVLMRSGAMSRLTEKDFAYLASLGLKTVVDFRDTRERTSEPVNWPADAKPQVFTKDYALDNGMFMNLLMKPGLSAEQAKQAMATFYRDVPNVFADQYRTLFDQLLASDGAVAFNCTAGKDRTGLAVALLHRLLGVHEDDVMADYLLTNAAGDQKRRIAAAGDSIRERYGAQITDEAIEMLMGVDAMYLDAATRSIVERFGTTERYAEEVLGVDAARRDALRARLLD